MATKKKSTVANTVEEEVTTSAVEPIDLSETPEMVEEPTEEEPGVTKEVREMLNTMNSAAEVKAPKVEEPVVETVPNPKGWGEQALIMEELSIIKEEVARIKVAIRFVMGMSATPSNLEQFKKSFPSFFEE